MDKRPPIPPKGMPPPSSFMERLGNRVVHGRLLPLLLLPVAISGFFCFTVFALPEAFRSTSRGDRVVAIVFSLIGIIGTFTTFMFLRAIRRRPPGWRVFDLGPTAWTVLVSTAWLMGIACGLFLIYETR